MSAGIGNDGLRSVSRSLSDPGEYRRLMDHADSTHHLPEKAFRFERIGQKISTPY
ncbi:MAG: hypothetical protein ABJD51_23080 [Roseobacter sp.]